jgi:hypothetical protein
MDDTNNKVASVISTTNTLLDFGGFTLGFCCWAPIPLPHRQPFQAIMCTQITMYLFYASAKNGSTAAAVAFLEDTEDLR